MLPNQTLNAILSSLRTFDPLSDTLDIFIISFVFYQLLQFARKSRAGQLVKGILLILVFYGLAVMLDLKTVTWVLNSVITIGFMAAVVIFQPELRRALERMGLFVGKIIYYLDAAEDYEKDTRNGAYNVFALQGLSKAEAVAEAQRLCRMCAGEAALAYNLLEPGPCKAILDNIVFLGLPQSIALAGQKRTQPRHGA